MSAKVSAVRAAAMWMNLVTNKLSLPHNNEVADADGDGMLDAEEFQALFDLDGDGDFDLISCEEVHDLGVFWYENPTR